MNDLKLIPIEDLDKLINNFVTEKERRAKVENEKKSNKEQKHSKSEIQNFEIQNEELINTTLNSTIDTKKEKISKTLKRKSKDKNDNLDKINNNSKTNPNKKINSDNTENDKESKASVKENKEKRKKVSVACILCRRSHLSCDDKRPCSRCIAKGVPNLCKDAPKKLTDPLKCISCPIFPNLTPAELQKKIHEMLELQKQQKELLDHLVSSKLITPEIADQVIDMNSANVLNYANNMASTTNLGNTLETSKDDINLEYDTNLYPIEMQNMSSTEELNIPTPNYNLGPMTFHSSVPCVPFNGVTPLFPSEASNSEYNSLVNYCHYVSSQDDMPKRCQTCPFGRVEQFLNVLEFKNSQQGQDKSIDIQNILLLKYQVGLIKPFNYAKGYLRLKEYIKNRLSSEHRQEMVNILMKYQENLKVHSMSIVDLDLLSIEEAFERLLIKFDRVFAGMPMPSCLWRRNGEIFKANHNFAFLTGLSMEKLSNGETTIYEIMAEGFAVDYWNKFTEIAFDTSQKAIISISALVNQSNMNRVIKCTFSFTIFRDKFQIPIAIIGNFIPSEPVFGHRNTFPDDAFFDSVDENGDCGSGSGCGCGCGSSNNSNDGYGSSNNGSYGSSNNGNYGNNNNGNYGSSNNGNYGSSSNGSYGNNSNGSYSNNSNGSYSNNNNISYGNNNTGSYSNNNNSGCCSNNNGGCCNNNNYNQGSCASDCQCLNSIN